MTTITTRSHFDLLTRNVSCFEEKIKCDTARLTMMLVNWKPAFLYLCERFWMSRKKMCESISGVISVVVVFAGSFCGWFMRCSATCSVLIYVIYRLWFALYTYATLDANSISMHVSMSGTWAKHSSIYLWGVIVVYNCYCLFYYCRPVPVYCWWLRGCCFCLHFIHMLSSECLPRVYRVTYVSLMYNYYTFFCI